jgi:paraquat-inducible protein A
VSAPRSAPVPLAAGDPDDAPAYLGCASCGLVSRNRLGAGRPDAVQRCPRCGEPLEASEPLAVQRTWACLIAAAVLYVPANALPIMGTTSGFRSEEHTLVGGIVDLWQAGSWFLAAIVFVASIVVPVGKIGVLALLAWSVRRAPGWRQIERARLFRLVEAVGHWSMLDVYVVVLLAATVRFGPLASATPGPGLLSFAAVVVFTMLATKAFDPKLIWQSPRADIPRS